MGAVTGCPSQGTKATDGLPSDLSISPSSQRTRVDAGLFPTPRAGVLDRDAIAKGFRLRCLLVLVSPIETTLLPAAEPRVRRVADCNWMRVPYTTISGQAMPPSPRMGLPHSAILEAGTATEIAFGGESDVMISGLS